VVFRRASHDRYCRNHQQGEQHGEHHPGVAPAELVDQVDGAGRDDHAAQGNPHGSPGNHLAPLLDEPLGHGHVNDQVADQCAAEGSDKAVEQKPVPELADQAVSCQRDCQHDGAKEHERPCADTIHISTDEETGDAHHDLADGAAEGEFGTGPAEVVDHGQHERPHDVADDAYGDELSYERGGHQVVAVIDSRAVQKALRGQSRLLEHSPPLRRHILVPCAALN